MVATQSPAARSLLPALSLGSLALLAGCGVRVFENEVLLHRAPETDVVRVVWIHRGVDVDPRAVKDGMQWVEDVLHLRRRVGAAPTGFLAFHFDLDELADGDLEPGDRHLLRGVRAVGAGAFLEEGRLSVWQDVRIANGERVIDRLNEGFSEWWLRDCAAEALEPDSDYPDSALLWKERAERGGPWFDLEGGRLSLRIPATSADATRFVSEGLRGLAQGEDLWGVRWWLDALSDLRIEEDEVVLSFGEVDGVLHLRSPEPELDEWTPRLLEALRTREVEIREDVSLADVRARVHGRPR